MRVWEKEKDVRRKNFSCNKKKSSIAEIFGKTTRQFKERIVKSVIIK